MGAASFFLGSGEGVGLFLAAAGGTSGLAALGGTDPDLDGPDPDLGGPDPGLDGTGGLEPLTFGGGGACFFLITTSSTIAMSSSSSSIVINWSPS